MIINKKTSLVLTLKDINDDVAGKTGAIQVLVMTKNLEAVAVKPVLDIGGGNYTVSFTPRTLGDHVISVVVDGQHIPGSPHKLGIVCVLLECGTSFMISVLTVM